MKLRLRWVATWLGAVLVASTGLVSAATLAQAATTTPGWEPDANSKGSVAFYNAAGVSITSGSTTDAPMASYYGVSGIPTVILTNEKGEVVSLNARGPELGKKLEELLGKAEGSKEESSKESSGDKAK